MSEELTWGREFLSNRPLRPSNNIKNVYIGKVLNVKDYNNTGIIQVFIDGVDEIATPNEQLPLCYPLMSRIIHVMPKENESVLVLMGSSDEDRKNTNRQNRFWIGPLITNYDNIKNDTVGVSKNLTFDPLSFLSINKKNTEKDIFPIDNEDPTKPNNLDDVTIIGRDNTDISQTENKIKLRAGKHKKNRPKELNTKNPVYSVLELIDDENSYSLTAGDEIYLISHKGKETFKKILSKDDINQLRRNTQSMLYGELTVEYLRLLTQAFLTHIHQHPQKEPIKKSDIVQLEKKLNQIQDLLAKNIKIN